MDNQSITKIQYEFIDNETDKCLRVISVPFVVFHPIHIRRMAGTNLYFNSHNVRVIVVTVYGKSCELISGPYSYLPSFLDSLPVWED